MQFNNIPEYAGNKVPSQAQRANCRIGNACQNSNHSSIKAGNAPVSKRVLFSIENREIDVNTRYSAVIFVERQANVRKSDRWMDGQIIENDNEFAGNYTST